MDEDVATVLLDGDRSDFLGGQFVHAVVASMDWGGMAEFFRTGTPIAERPDRYRAAIETLTRQDIAVFFQEVLAALPQLAADLSRGGRVVDVHCGGGRWLVAMARRFPALELVGVEREADSVARARAAVVAEGLADRIDIREAKATEPGSVGEYDLAYFQYALHQLDDAPQVLRAAWAALHPGGRLLVLDWPLPSGPDEFRTRHGEIIAGVQLDELYQGTALASRERFLAWFEEAGLPAAGGDRPAVRRDRVPRGARDRLARDLDGPGHVGVDLAEERVRARGAEGQAAGRARGEGLGGAAWVVRERGRVRERVVVGPRDDVADLGRDQRR